MTLNWSFILGLGLGMVLAVSVLLLQGSDIPRDRVETLAREMGMVYPSEVIIFESQTEGQDNYSR